MKSQTFTVEGMHCASCSQIIRRKLSQLEGVRACDVNFATEKAKIEYEPHTVSMEKMNQAIAPIGYKLMDHSMHDMSGMDHSSHLGLHQSKEAKSKELQEEKNKTLFAFPIALLIFIFMIWDILARSFTFIPSVPFSMSLTNTISFILATIILFWIGSPFIKGVVTFIKHHVANMDTLIGIGTLTAYIYSSILFIFPQVKNFMHAPEFLYFDVVIVVIGFVKLGKYLEARSKLKTGEAIEKLMNLQAKTALVLRNDKEVELPIGEVRIGDTIIIKPGAKLPVDGVILEGFSSIDESMINGEPIPVDKKIGDIVIGSTINKQGHFIFRATKVGADTMLSQIIKMVEEAQGSKAPIQGLADTISSIFVPVVLVIAVISFLIWTLVGNPTNGLICFVGVLVIACPCALGLATPTAIIVGIGKGAESGILIKNAESLEKMQEVDTIVMDKTGTITNGKPLVTDVIVFDSKIKEYDLLQMVASIEKKSEHPLAQAIVDKAIDNNIPLHNVENFRAMEGVGVEAKINNNTIVIRKPSIEETTNDIQKLQAQGKTVVVVLSNETLVGIIAISDTIKGYAIGAIDALHKLAIRVIMLTGDNQKTAQYIASQVHIDEVIAEVLPQDKSKKIKELQLKGRIVAMAGDGINDAPALSQADVGIAMATGTDIAIESADVILLNGDIKKIADSIKLSRSTVRTIKQNLFWAFIYNLIGIPLAAGLLYPVFGILLNPMFAGLAMAGSSVSVVLNSLRLRGIRLNKS